MQNSEDQPSNSSKLSVLFSRFGDSRRNSNIELSSEKFIGLKNNINKKEMYGDCDDAEWDFVNEPDRDLRIEENQFKKKDTSKKLRAVTTDVFEVPFYSLFSLFGAFFGIPLVNSRS